MRPHTVTNQCCLYNCMKLMACGVLRAFTLLVHHNSAAVSKSINRHVKYWESGLVRHAKWYPRTVRIDNRAYTDRFVHLV